MYFPKGVFTSQNHPVTQRGPRPADVFLSVLFRVIMSRLNQGCGGVGAPGSRRGHAPAIISSRGAGTYSPREALITIRLQRP